MLNAKGTTLFESLQRGRELARGQGASVMQEGKEMQLPGNLQFPNTNQSPQVLNLVKTLTSQMHHSSPDQVSTAAVDHTLLSGAEIG